MIGKDAVPDTLRRYRQIQVQVDSKVYATKDEIRGYINRIEQVDDGIFFLQWRRQRNSQDTCSDEESEFKRR